MAFNYLDDHWNDEQRKKFNTLEYKEFAPVYYGYAIEDDLQNHLLKNHEASVKLNSFFDSLGVYRPKDKSGLILNTYFNYTNQEQLELQHQVENVKAYWKPIEDCEKSIKAKAIKTYSSFKVNDAIAIRLPVDEHNNAIDFECPDNSWVFREGEDLEVTAILIEKSITKDSLDASFKLKLLNKSNNDTEILYQEIYEGNSFTIPLSNSWKISQIKPTNETETINL
ncbi:DUF6794 domain-containing protein [Winogradskyella schleiferi]|uniref:DUF6794 domain-containing protein n=1 Tax=Winogradskyella schleiferi TaxID=2686078 RepID=UPI0015BF90C4